MLRGGRGERDDETGGAQLAGVVERLRAEGLEVGGGQALKGAPRGYPGDHPRIELSEEAERLDTGGGVARAMPLLGEAFFVVNSDVFWRDGRMPALLRLAAAFDPEATDAVLLLQGTATAVGYEGNGDYFFDAGGNPRRRREGELAPYLFAGIQLLYRRLFEEVPGPVFSRVRLFDRAEVTGRLAAIVHDGEWYHVGTPEGLALTRERLASQRIEP